jgi:hypothetical protein
MRHLLIRLAAISTIVSMSAIVIASDIEPSRSTFYDVPSKVFEYYDEDQAFTDMINELAERKDPQALAIKALSCCDATVHAYRLSNHPILKESAHLKQFERATPAQIIRGLSGLTEYVFIRDLENGSHDDRNHYVDLYTYTRLVDYVYPGIKTLQPDGELEKIFNYWAENEAILPFSYKDYRKALSIQEIMSKSAAKLPGDESQLRELNAEINQEHLTPSNQARLSDFRQVINCLQGSLEYYCRNWNGDGDFNKVRVPLSLPRIQFN